MSCRFWAVLVLAPLLASTGCSFYLDRPVVQVEGIVNSNEFLDAVRANHAHAFLRRARVTYYAKSAKLANRLLLEHDGGPDPGAKECGFRFEPYFGAGDKVVFDVCRSTLVFTLPLAHGEQLVVWRYTGGPGNFHTPGATSLPPAIRS